MVAPFLGGHWSVVVPAVVSASPMRHWADATLAPGLYRPEILLYDPEDECLFTTTTLSFSFFLFPLLGGNYCGCCHMHWVRATQAF